MTGIGSNKRPPPTFELFILALILAFLAVFLPWFAVSVDTTSVSYTENWSFASFSVTRDTGANVYTESSPYSNTLFPNSLAHEDISSSRIQYEEIEGRILAVISTFYIWLVYLVLLTLGFASAALVKLERAKPQLTARLSNIIMIVGIATLVYFTVGYAIAQQADYENWQRTAPAVTGILGFGTRPVGSVNLNLSWGPGLGFFMAAASIALSFVAGSMFKKEYASTLRSLSGITERFDASREKLAAKRDASKLSQEQYDKKLAALDEKEVAAKSKFETREAIRIEKEKNKLLLQLDKGTITKKEYRMHVEELESPEPECEKEEPKPVKASKKKKKRTPKEAKKGKPGKEKKVTPGEAKKEKPDKSKAKDKTQKKEKGEKKQKARDKRSKRQGKDKEVPPSEGKGV